MFVHYSTELNFRAHYPPVYVLFFLNRYTSVLSSFLFTYEMFNLFKNRTEILFIGLHYAIIVALIFPIIFVWIKCSIFTLCVR